MKFYSIQPGPLLADYVRDDIYRYTIKFLLQILPAEEKTPILLSQKATLTGMLFSYPGRAYRRKAKGFEALTLIERRFLTGYIY